MLNKKTLSSKIAIVAMTVLLLFFADLKFKQWKNQNEIEKQKQALIVQAESLQKKNNELSQSLQYLNSPEFKERVARQQLNLKKEGETVYSFGDAQVLGANTSGTNETQATNNALKWWNYFFSTTNNF